MEQSCLLQKEAAWVKVKVLVAVKLLFNKVNKFSQNKEKRKRIHIYNERRLFLYSILGKIKEWSVNVFRGFSFIYVKTMLIIIH